MFVHGVNVLISGVVAKISAGNACVLYFLNILIDTTLGKQYLVAEQFSTDPGVDTCRSCDNLPDPPSTYEFYDGEMQI